MVTLSFVFLSTQYTVVVMLLLHQTNFFFFFFFLRHLCGYHCTNCGMFHCFFVLGFKKNHFSKFIFAFIGLFTQEQCMFFFFFLMPFYFLLRHISFLIVSPDVRWLWDW